ncbi:MAG: hypothetical protein P8J87_15135 [Verrucomicrobiales bacterium]|nr:hypothetical protein [Verrucomicrobiales bacterium]
MRFEKIVMLLAVASLGVAGVSCSSMEPDGATKIVTDLAEGGASPIDGPEVKGSAPDMSNRAGRILPGGPLRWRMRF